MSVYNNQKNSGPVYVKIDTSSLCHVVIDNNIISGIFLIKCKSSFNEKTFFQVRIGKSTEFSRMKLVTKFSISSGCEEIIPIKFKTKLEYDSEICILQYDKDNLFNAGFASILLKKDNSIKLAVERFSKFVASPEYVKRFLNVRIVLCVKDVALNSKNTISGKIICHIHSKDVGYWSKLELITTIDDKMEQMTILHTIQVEILEEETTKLLPFEILVQDNTTLWVKLYKQDQIEYISHFYVNLIPEYPTNIVNENSLSKVICETEEERYWRLFKITNPYAFNDTFFR